MSHLSNIKKFIKKWFTTHPESMGESYFQHFSFAVWLGVRAIIAGMAILLHGVFPFILEKTGSAILQNIMQDIEKRKNKSVSK